jgi:hypothetical protein
MHTRLMGLSTPAHGVDDLFCDNITLALFKTAEALLFVSNPWIPGWKYAWE